jgi:hypothetical protein
MLNFVSNYVTPDKEKYGFSRYKVGELIRRIQSALLFAKKGKITL